MDRSESPFTRSQHCTLAVGRDRPGSRKMTDWYKTTRSRWRWRSVGKCRPAGDDSAAALTELGGNGARARVRGAHGRAGSGARRGWRGEGPGAARCSVPRRYVTSRVLVSRCTAACIERSRAVRCNGVPRLYWKCSYVKVIFCYTRSYLSWLWFKAK